MWHEGRKNVLKLIEQYILQLLDKMVFGIMPLGLRSKHQKQALEVDLHLLLTVLSSGKSSHPYFMHMNICECM
jgi:hypothetical protein